MKISAFHLMPHRELPADFEQRYESVWVTPPWWELADARRVGQYYNWTLDELQYAAKCGFDGVCTNEHHQNAYGFMPSPNLMGSVLARATNGTNVAIVQMGATLPTSNPPLRVADNDLVNLPLRWDGQRVLVIGHVATRWGLDHFLSGVPLEDLIEQDFAWQEGWEYQIS